jgi:hypothetical protein
VPKTHYPFSLHKFTSSTGDVANIKKDFRDLDQRVDRDDNASKNIALRALRLKTCPPHFIRWQLRGTTETANPQVVPFVDITTISTNPQLTTIVRI